MPHIPSDQENLASNLPLPLARLYRRACNEKDVRQRHNAAYYLWEASLKLLGSVAVVCYAERPEADREIAERLRNLARPAVGHWWEFVRLLTPRLRDAGFGPTADFLLGKPIADLPRAAGLDAALMTELEGRSTARATLEPARLFDRLIAYRNRELGHGAAGQKQAAHYERIGRILLLGIGELLGRLDVLAGHRLIYVVEVRRRSDGSWLVEQADLSREMYQRAESLVVPADGADLLPRPERLYLRPSADPLGKLRALHPLVLYDAEADEVLFLNSRRGKARTEYLDYSSGRVVEKAELAGEQRELLRQVLNLPAEEIALDAWAARLATEEGAEIVPTAGESPHEPRRLGEFELISELGRGAMGIVYRAEQPSLHRQVAVKRMFRTGDPKAEARFAREIRALGQVDHPHLVKIHASGSEGEHWFYAMERIEGATLAAVCDRLQSRATTTAGLNLPTWQDAISSACVEARHHEQPLSGDVRADVGVDAGGESGLRPEDSRDLSERVPHLAIRSYERHVAELIRQVAEAVHALHEKGIIHRDIKPGNIMVTTDGSTAVLMDLGLAQIADEVEGRLTRTRQFVGTLRYASPEQVQAVRRLDARSDVYSLGATLWEMLTLQPLFGATEATPTPKLMEQIGLEEPGHVRTHNRSASRDLEKIVEKCLQKKAADRYATARELAEDLRRYLGDEPVRARKVTSLERGLKWVRRRPALACTIAAAIVAVTLVTALAFAQILTERNRLRVERDRAEANLLRSLVSDTRAQMLARDTGWWWKAMENLESATRLDVPGRDVSELRDLAIQCMGTEYPCFRLTRTWQGHSGPVTSLAVAPNGRMAVTGGDDRTVRLWSVPDGKQLAVLTGPTQRVTSVSFHPSGRFIAAGSADGFVRLWDLRSGSKDEAELAGLDRRTSSLELSAAATAVEFSPDGKWLAIGCQDGAVRIMAANADELAGSGLAPTGTPGHRVLKGHHGAITCLAFVPVSMQLASSSEDRTIRFWEPASGEQMSTVSTRSVARCIAFHGGGTILAYAEPAAYGFNLQDLRTGVSLGRGNVHGGAVTQIRSDARNRLLTASLDGTLKLWWDGQSSRDRWTVLLAVAREHLSECRCAAFGPGDAPWVIAGHADGQVRLWELSEPPQRALVPGGTQQAVFLGPRRVLCPPFSCDFDRRNRGADVVLLPPPVTALAVHPSDHRFAFAREGAVHVWDSKERKELTSWPAHDAKINALVCRPDGEQLVSAAADGTIRLWDWKGKSKGTLPAAKIEAVHALAWDRTGRRLAASGSCGAVIWDMRSGAGPQRISEHHLSASAIAFGLDVLAVSGPDGTVDVLSIETGARLRTLRGHSALVSALEFAPDGSELASAAPDGTIRLWDTKTWSELAALREETTLGTSLSFDPSGCYLAANGSHNTQLWDLKTSRVVALLDGDQCGRINAESEILLGTGGGSVMRYALSELIHPQAVDGASGKGPRLSGPLLVDPQPPLVLGPENPNRIWGMAVSPNGRWFVTATFDGGVFLWDAQSFKCVRSLTGQGGEVWCAAFSSDSRYLASGGIRGNSGEIKIWDASTGEEVWDCPGHTDEVTALAFHPTRPWLASGSDDGSVRFWNVAERKPLGILHQFKTKLTGLSFRPDGRRLAAGCRNDQIAIWNVPDSLALPSPPDRILDGNSGNVRSVTFSSDGRYFASGSDQGAVILRDGDSFERLATLQGSVHQVRSLSFNRDSQLLAAGHYVAPAIVWDLSALRDRLKKMKLDW